MMIKNNKHPQSGSLLRYGVGFSLGCILLSHSQLALAFSFLTFEARSAAMGGVGVATGTRNASFYNPALLATADEAYDWYAVVPAYSESEVDPDNLNGRLRTFQANQTNGNLDALSGISLHERENVSLALGVPSTIISGTAYLNEHTFHTVKTAIISNDALNSTIQHRTAEVKEFGFSLARPMTVGFMDIGPI